MGEVVQIFFLVLFFGPAAAIRFSRRGKDPQNYSACGLCGLYQKNSCPYFPAEREQSNAKGQS